MKQGEEEEEWQEDSRMNECERDGVPVKKVRRRDAQYLLDRPA